MAAREDMFKSLSVPETFDFTPELVAQRKKGRQFHPDLTSDEPSKWKLPALDDKSAILNFLGFSKDGIPIMLDAYGKKYAADPEELAVKNVSDTGLEFYKFPLLQRLVDLYVKRSPSDDMYDHDETYESAVRKGVQQGLRPEFAIRVALHPDEPDYTEEFAEVFGMDGAFYQCNEVVDANAAYLLNAWNKQMASPTASKA